jgi:DNA-binding response OmpR family regulator
MSEETRADRGDSLSVLVIEGDDSLRRFLTLSLTTAGFRVTGAAAPEEGMRLAAEESPALVCLDVDRSEGPSREAIGEFKRRFGVPIVVTTGETDEDVLLDYLARGADDILLMPYLPDAIEEAVRFLLDAVEERTEAGETRKVGDVEIIPRQRRVTLHGKPVSLSLTEWRLLEPILSQGGLPILHKELLTRAWGSSFQRHVRFLDAWMTRLRHKLAGEGTQTVIEDFAGVGYALGPTEPRDRAR